MIGILRLLRAFDLTRRSPTCQYDVPVVFHRYNIAHRHSGIRFMTPEGAASTV